MTTIPLMQCYTLQVRSLNFTKTVMQMVFPLRNYFILYIHVFFLNKNNIIIIVGFIMLGIKAHKSDYSIISRIKSRSTFTPCKPFWWYLPFIKSRITMSFFSSSSNTQHDLSSLTPSQRDADSELKSLIVCEIGTYMQLNETTSKVKNMYI